MRLRETLQSFAESLSLSANVYRVRRVVGVVRSFIFRQRVLELSAVTRQQVEDYLSSMTAARASPGTLKNHAHCLAQFFAWLVSRGLLAENVAHGIKTPRVEDAPPNYLRKDELRYALLLAVREGIHDELCAAAYTGLRANELRCLAWEDVDLDRAVLTVRQSKNGHFRTVPLCRRALLMFRHRKRQQGPLETIVFPSTRRNGHSGLRSKNWWVHALDQIRPQIPRFTAKGTPGAAFHLLRHTFASMKVQAGVSLYKVGHWLGHRSSQMTKRYAHLAPDFDPDIERGV